MVSKKLTPIFTLTIILCATFLPHTVEGILKRCVQCRSRGELGSCKDKFTMNATQIAEEHGVEAVPCASGWCGKIIESQNLNNEYGTATQRMCLQRGPDDYEERCSNTIWNYKKVYICFCLGDLCNASTRTILPSITVLIVIGFVGRWFIL
ncbi:uncharacterized protein LOC124184487 [Neodiprion fabricii]|uniref:uncharacterized protein LOC124184487 n=1 Tax=Neodiprion fabricii TaxID=2872261 RepID=UPI001ED925B4|nr:uncharacterized protein LOC124184487 [Neodiprion fabricii]